MVDYDIRLTQWAFSGAIEEQHLGHWDIVGHDSHIQRSQTFRVHTENFIFISIKIISIIFIISFFIIL